MNIIARTLATALILASPAAFAHDYQLGDLHIDHPWTRATLPSAKVGGGYLVLTNEGALSDRLLGGTTPVAGRVEVHSMEVKDDIMVMRPLTDGLEIPASQTVELVPGGYHLMLMELTQPLKEGERIPVTLEFEKAGKIDVELAVEAPGAGNSHDHDHHHDHGDAQTHDDGQEH